MSIMVSPIPQTCTETVVYTIGYEGLNVETFLAKLKKNGIRRIIDIRCNAFSRKPGFSKSRLSAVLQEHGIDYVHIPQLGIPSSLRKNLHDPEDYVSLFKIYVSEILPTVEEYIETALSLIDEEPSALLCFEKDYSQCHRSHLSWWLCKHYGLQQNHMQ